MLGFRKHVRQSNVGEWVRHCYVTQIYTTIFKDVPDDFDPILDCKTVFQAKIAGTGDPNWWNVLKSAYKKYPQNTL